MNKKKHQKNSAINMKLFLLDSYDKLQFIEMNRRVLTNQI